MFYSECLNKEKHPKRNLKRKHPKRAKKVNIQNGYGTTKTAHLFTDTQRIFFNKYKSPIVCNEMVMPTPRNGHGYNHAGVIRRGDAQLNILFSFLTEMQIGPYLDLIVARRLPLPVYATAGVGSSTAVLVFYRSKNNQYKGVISSPHLHQGH